MSRYRRGPSVWSQSRAAAAGFGVFVGAAIIAVGLPLGFGLWVALTSVLSAWPPPEMWPPGGNQERTAMFARVAAKRLRVPNPYAVGFGDPGENKDRGQKSLWPPNRLSSWWGLVFAAVFTVLLGGLYSALRTRFFRDEFNWPFPDLPGENLLPVTGLFMFLIWQAFAAGMREIKEIAEPQPAVLLRKDDVLGFFPGKNLIGFAGAGAVVAVLGTVAAKVFGLPWWPLVGSFTGLVVSGAAFSVSYSQKSLEEWRTELRRREEWQKRWEEIPRLGVAPPVYVTEYAFPDEQNPTHIQATFVAPGSIDFAKYEPHAAALATALQSDMVLIAPMPRTDANGEFMLGYAKEGAFTVTWATRPMGRAPHLDASLDGQTLVFAIRVAFKEAFRGLNLGVPEFAGAATLTNPKAGKILLETKWRLTGGVTHDMVAAKASALAEKIGAKWLRVGRRSANDPQGGELSSEFISIVFGERPDSLKDNELRSPIRETRRFLDILEWDGAFRACGIVGARGDTPQLKSKSPVGNGINEMIFSCAEGIAVDTVKSAVPKLMATTGLAYVAVERVDDAGRFRLVSGQKDPLDGSYLFVDYLDHLFSTPEVGRERMDWKVGVTAEGSLFTYKWDDEFPHLLIAGGSGMGKSSVINSMLLQMCHNNSPNDLQLRLLEPKNELNAFAGLAHVTHYVDKDTPGDFFPNAAEFLHGVYDEMNTRYRLMRNHPAHPQKITEARYIAQQEGPDEEGNPHPLDMPYIVVVVEEASSIFRKPSLKRFWNDYEACVYYSEELARLSRAVGIYLVIATQYPTKENLPSTIKQQCRRLGLGVSQQVASLVIIDEPGLEMISSPGRGLISHGKGYRGFRAFYLRKPTIENPDMPDDRAIFLAEIEQARPDRVFSSGTSMVLTVPEIPRGIWEDEDDQGLEDPVPFTKVIEPDPGPVFGDDDWDIPPASAWENDLDIPPASSWG